MFKIRKGMSATFGKGCADLYASNDTGFYPKMTVGRLKPRVGRAYRPLGLGKNTFFNRGLPQNRTINFTRSISSATSVHSLLRELSASQTLGSERSGAWAPGQIVRKLSCSKSRSHCNIRPPWSLITLLYRTSALKEGVSVSLRFSLGLTENLLSRATIAASDR
jgi:hypothetical protein